MRHPCGDAIPNPFPPSALNLRNLKQCVSPAFCKHICSKHTNPVGEAIRRRTLHRPPWSLWAVISKLAKRYTGNGFSSMSLNAIATQVFSVRHASSPNMLNCAQPVLIRKHPPNISKRKRGRKSSQPVLPRSVTNQTINHIETSLYV